MAQGLGLRIIAAPQAHLQSAVREPLPLSLQRPINPAQRANNKKEINNKRENKLRKYQTAQKKH